MRIILAVNHRTISQDMRNRLYLLSLDSRQWFLKLQLAFNIVDNVQCLQQLEGYLVKRPYLHGRILKDSTLLNITPSKMKMGQSTFKCDAAQEWNGLPREIRELNTLSKFKTHIFKHYMEQDRINHVYMYHELGSIFLLVYLLLLLFFFKHLFLYNIQNHCNF